MKVSNVVGSVENSQSDIKFNVQVPLNIVRWLAKTVVCDSAVHE